MRKLSREPKYKLNAVCPYYTMFPLEFPINTLRTCNKDTVVLDVFCGRGTTNYAAEVHGLLSYGIDASPVAVKIAKAKLSNTTVEEVMELFDLCLENSFPEDIPEGEFWERAYHEETLRQICTIREALMSIEESSASSMLYALMMGCLHGPKTKSKKNASYFSNQMPRTFGAKPDYAVKFWKKKRLKPWKLDIRKIIKKKAELVLKYQNITSTCSRNIFNEDSTQVEYRKLFNEKINLVITSPPYYGMNTYIEDQWIRNWFVGGDSYVNYKKNQTIKSFSVENFTNSLTKTWDRVAAIAADDFKMIIRFGSLGSRKCDHVEVLQNSLSDSSEDWKIYYRKSVGTSKNGRRQANLMGKVSESSPIEETDFFIKLN